MKSHEHAVGTRVLLVVSTASHSTLFHLHVHTIEMEFMTLAQPTTIPPFFSLAQPTTIPPLLSGVLAMMIMMRMDCF